MSKPILGYWDFRGMGHPIRSLLAYAGVDFEDRHYAHANGGKAWYDAKFTLGLDFPNIPYLIDGDVKLTQTLAILRYLGAKYGLEGVTETEKNRISVLELQVQDLTWQGLYKVIWSPDYEALKPDYDRGLPDQIGALSRFLGTNTWSAGERLTYVDFWLYEFLVKIESYSPGILGPFANLREFIKRIEALPTLAAWRAKTGPLKFLSFGAFQNEY